MNKTYLKPFYMILLLAMLFISFNIKIKAETKTPIFTCEYDVTITPESDSGWWIFKFHQDRVGFPLKVEVYSSTEAKFINAGHEMKHGSSIYLDKTKTYGGVQISVDTKDYAKRATANDKYNCPSLTLDVSNSNMYYLHNEDFGNREGSGEYMYVTKGETPNLTDNTQDGSQDKNILEETTVCNTKISNLNTIKFNPTITFKMFNNGEKKFCIKIDNLDESCGIVKNDGGSLYYSSGSNYTFIITEDQVPKIFKQGNMAMINNSAFECPTEAYIYLQDGTVGSGTYLITTDEKEAEEGIESSELEKAPDDTEDDDSSNYNGGTEVNGCEVVPPVVKKWIKVALNFVKYVALVLVIVLGTLDFIKAAGSGEPDAMKKAGQAFIKRVVAVIILFLLPMIVELLLNLIELYGANTDCFGVLE